MGLQYVVAKRVFGIHRKVVDLVAVGLVDIMAEELTTGISNTNNRSFKH